MLMLVGPQIFPMQAQSEDKGTPFMKLCKKTCVTPQFYT